MAVSRPLYCWDAGVFIAWFGAEADKPLDDISLVVAEIDRNAADLLVPVTAYAEILDTPAWPNRAEQFRKFVRRSNVVIADTTQAIAEKAGEIRSRGAVAQPKRSIKTPDALFLATAVIYKATVFHTTELTKLPNLSGSDIVEGLRIEAPKPHTGQQSFLNPG